MKIPGLRPALSPAFPALLALLALLPPALLAGCRAGGAAPGRAADPPAERERLAGLLELELERSAGRLWLLLPDELPEDGRLARLLLVEGIATGLGSNPVGLDRGRLGRARVVALRRVGASLLVEEENHAFRAESEESFERRAARESFATSVLWAGAIERGADGREAVEFTSFALRDASGVARALRDAGQGEFRLDEERSVLDPSACHAFPSNVELQAILTFTSDAPGPEVRRVAPAPEAVTLVQHVSLVRLPEEGFVPRRFDPRSGAIPLRFQDHAAPPGEGVERAFAIRHRLDKANPGAAVSDPVRPIVFHVDRGVPEPVRSALIEGASWWEPAFREAGFTNAIAVELLPEGAHPLDARYNVIQWVHRATRGWSYGNSIVDPRTGEIVKAHVSLGSQRVRHDVLLFEGLAGTRLTGSGAPDDPVELALDRIRQLAAHEVGHTLGLAHNFAASTFGDRASVMDYPAPLVRVAQDGELDFSRAYGRGVGEWDVLAIRWLYEQPPVGVDVEARMARLLEDGEARGLRFLGDDDARGRGAAHPQASLWDNGPNPLVELFEVLAVRRVALARFGLENVHPGQPLGRLREVFAPLYLHHRYQAEACARLLGGVNYDHALRGGIGAGRSTPVNGDVQRRALDALLSTLDPAFLDVREDTLRLLLPSPPGSRPGSEVLASRSGPVFDLMAAAESAAAIVLDALLAPERCARLVEQHARMPQEQLGLEEMLATLLRRAFNYLPEESPVQRELRRVVQGLAAERIRALASNEAASPAVRWRAESSLRGLAALLRERTSPHPTAQAFEQSVVAELERYFAREAHARPAPTPPSSPPPGPPIGAAGGIPDLLGCSAPP